MKRAAVAAGMLVLVAVWFGPLLVTRTESGFSGVAATGGYAGVAL